MGSTANQSGHYTLAEGAPAADNTVSIRLRNSIGGGLSLLQDTQPIETLAHFSRERIQERYAYGGRGEEDSAMEMRRFPSFATVSGVRRRHIG